MSGIILRMLIFGFIGIAIYLGISKIWRDWTSQFKREETEVQAKRRERDLSERQRPDVIDLKRDGDGIFRPGDGDRNNRR